MGAGVDQAIGVAPRREGVNVVILGGLSLSHFLNDLIQSLLPAVYPILKESLSLDFSQVGLITLTMMLTASLLQPAVGLYTDRYPKPYSLMLGMSLSLAGLLLLASAPNFAGIIAAAALIGTGSSIFHPESSRVARLASHGRYGLAQSVFQVGGNAGTAIGPLLAALIVIPNGRTSIAWFSLAALLGIVLLARVGSWYSGHMKARAAASGTAVRARSHLPRRRVTIAIAVLIALIFSKYFYQASFISYYTFYLMQRFGLPVQAAQFYLFLFLGSIALGTLLGGPVGDRFGRRFVIWVSILGVLPFTLVLPHANLFWTAILSVVIGLVLASAFSAILVYAQELLPGRVGMVGGLFFGFAFGMGGLGAAVLGELADRTSIQFVYQVCAFLPLIGILTVFLPNTRPESR